MLTVEKSFSALLLLPIKKQVVDLRAKPTAILEMCESKLYPQKVTNTVQNVFLFKDYLNIL
jgi:hypothetical protein